MIKQLDAAMSFHENALRVRGKRQEIIAANIANADTPKYKARDMDFKSVMQQSLGNTTNPAQISPAALNAEAFRNASSLLKTSSAHLEGTPTSANLFGNATADALYRPIVQGSVDGNTVDMDVERNAFADNALRYEASVNMISGQIKKMLTAITGQ
jgi:flagellar basal-body rod protein FlgB